jgi:hypothetical protein
MGRQKAELNWPVTAFVRKGHVMSKRENEANNVFRPSDSPLTEYEKEQIALRKNLERLKVERLAREAANVLKKKTPKVK